MLCVERRNSNGKTLPKVLFGATIVEYQSQMSFNENPSEAKFWYL
jgi:hypothetical protein